MRRQLEPCTSAWRETSILISFSSWRPSAVQLASRHASDHADQRAHSDRLSDAINIISQADDRRPLTRLPPRQRQTMLSESEGQRDSAKKLHKLRLVGTYRCTEKCNNVESKPVEFMPVILTTTWNFTCISCNIMKLRGHFYWDTVYTVYTHLLVQYIILTANLPVTIGLFEHLSTLSCFHGSVQLPKDNESRRQKQMVFAYCY